MTELTEDGAKSKTAEPPVLLEAIFEFGKQPITCLSFSRGSELIHAIDSSFKLVMLDPRKRQVVRHYQLPARGRAICVDWSAEGRHVAIGGFNGTEVYEVWSGECVVKIPPHINWVSRLAWSNGRRTLAIGERSIRLWNTASERYEVSLDAHQYDISALAWSKDDLLLASADSRECVIVWDVGSGTPIVRLPAQTNMINSLAWSPDSRYLAISLLLRKPTVGQRGEAETMWGISEGLTVFDFQKGEIVAEIASPWITALAFHPLGGGFGDLLITKGRDEVKIWKYGTWECLCTIPEKSGNYVRPAIAIHPHGNRFCTLDREDKAIRLWKYDLEKLVALTKPCAPDLSQGETVEFSDAVSEIGVEHDRGKFSALLKKVLEAQAAKGKGDALEAFCKEMFLLHKGFKVESNVITETEEIDLTIQNWGRGIGWLDDHAFYILGECKNWSKKCGKDEYVLFEKKLRNRRRASTLGFLIAWNGFADTVEIESLRGSHEGIVIGLLTGDDLKEIAEKGNLLEVLFRAYDKAVMR